VLSSGKFFGRAPKRAPKNRRLKKKKAENLERLENYFKRWPEFWRLYEYAKNCDIDFEIQPAGEALDDILTDLVQWELNYFRRERRTKKKIKIFEVCGPLLIIAPFDVLTIRERQRAEKYYFLADNLRDLTDLLNDDLIFLERMPTYLERLKKKIAGDEEIFLKEVIYSLSHEIGHWKLAQSEAGNCETCLLVLMGGAGFRGCFLKERGASLRGMEILEELNLLEFVGREWFLEETQKIASRQCDYCLELIESGVCPQFSRPG
jgi:hypothetical protein